MFGAPLGAARRRRPTPATRLIIVSDAASTDTAAGTGTIEGNIMSDLVVVEDDGAVRIIRMNRPEKKNALTQPMYAVMTRALREANDNDAIHCIVIASGPGAFCAG